MPSGNGELVGNDLSMKLLSFLMYIYLYAICQSLHANLSLFFGLLESQLAELLFLYAIGVTKGFSHLDKCRHLQEP